MASVPSASAVRWAGIGSAAVPGPRWAGTPPTRRFRGSGRFATTITMLSQNARHTSATAQITQIAAGDAVVRTAA